MFDADTGCIATDPAPSARRRFRSKTGIENLPANEHAQAHTPSPTNQVEFSQGARVVDPAFGMGCRPSQHIGIESEVLAILMTMTGRRISRRSLEDGLENFDAAFAAYARGNAMARHHYDVAKNLAEVEAIATHAGKRAGRRRAIVRGGVHNWHALARHCARILACHPAVYGAGELMLVPKFEESVNPDEITSTVLDQFANDHLDFLHDQSGGAARVIDKLPHNHRFLGLIERLFPEARVIHCTRDPLDTCLSCYFQNFYGGHRYSFDMKTLGGHYRLYQRLMAHWRKVSGLNILDVSYESLVADQETISRSLVAFLGLEWDPACLDFHRSDRPALTASYEQVRQPIYSRSVRRAEKYAAHLEPLIAALEGRDGVAAA